MRELLRGYAAATFETARNRSSLSTLHDELLVFSRVLSSSEDLRGALSNVSIDAHVRRDLVVDLLEGKATDETITLLSFAIRFERPSELASTIGALVIVAEERLAANDDEMEPQAAYGATRERIRGYAERVFQELPSVNELDEIEDELFRFARLLDDNAAFRRVLSDPDHPYQGRVGIVDDLLSAKVRSATLRIVHYVLRAGRVRDLVAIFEQLTELAAAERGRRVGEVRSAIDLDNAEKQRLSTALSRLVERPVEVRVVHDPKVIGGMLVSVGDLVIDGSIRVRFERLRDLLAQAS